MEPDFVEECLSVLARTPGTLDALLRDLPDAWTVKGGVKIDHWGGEKVDHFLGS